MARTDDPAPNRTFTVRCPCCSASMDVDAATGAIVKHRASPKNRGHQDFDQLLDRVDEDRQRANAVFEQECAAHEDRERLLEKRFQDALSRVDEVDDKTPPPSPFDP